jgi:hypothetical protein
VIRVEVLDSDTHRLHSKRASLGEGTNRFPGHLYRVKLADLTRVVKSEQSGAAVDTVEAPSTHRSARRGRMGKRLPRGSGAVCLASAAKGPMP